MVENMRMKFGIISVVIFMSRNDHTCEGTDIPYNGDGYYLTPGIGWHKFHDQAESWNEARKICMKEGGHLAILDSKSEEQLLSGILTRDYENIVNARHKDAAWLGYHNYFQVNEWVTIHGDPISDTGFDPWHRSHGCWGPQPDNILNMHCGSLIRLCGMMDDAMCCWRYAFFCEKPEFSGPGALHPQSTNSTEMPVV